MNNYTSSQMSDTHFNELTDLMYSIFSCCVGGLEKVLILSKELPSFRSGQDDKKSIMVKKLLTLGSAIKVNNCTQWSSHTVNITHK